MDDLIRITRDCGRESVVNRIQKRTKCVDQCERNNCKVYNSWLMQRWSNRYSHFFCLTTAKQVTLTGCERILRVFAVRRSEVLLCECVVESFAADVLVSLPNFSPGSLSFVVRGTDVTSSQGRKIEYQGLTLKE